MRVKCIKQDVGIYQSLIIGKSYVVNGMYISGGEFYYHICTETNASYPLPMKPDYFEIIDNRLSKYWVFGFLEGFESPRWTFPEWAQDPYFQDRLTDWNPREVEIFQSYRKLMDLEFPDPSIVTAAEVGDEQWLLCPNCVDAWQSSDDKDAMVICPKCKKMMHNPRYQNLYPHI